MNLWATGALLMVISARVACPESWHEPPVQLTAGATTRINARFSHEAGIKEIRVDITKGIMTKCGAGDGFPSYVPCRDNAVNFQVRCQFDVLSPTAVCTPFTEVLADKALVTYSAEAVTGDGHVLRDEAITFAVGAPTGGGVLQPVYWHRDASLESKIDLVFLPDVGFKFNASGLNADIALLVSGAFWGGSRFSSSYAQNRDVFNLWVARKVGQLVDPQSLCDVDIPNDLAQVQLDLDGIVFVHESNLRECSTVSIRGRGTVNPRRTRAEWILVHESGHFLHGQADEYCCDGGYSQPLGVCSNIFSSPDDCRLSAGGFGFAPELCVSLQTPGGLVFWRIDDRQSGLPETMELRGPPPGTEDSEWGAIVARCIVERFVRCRAQGTCS